jgi:hypothetical protein
MPNMNPSGAASFDRPLRSRTDQLHDEDYHTEYLMVVGSRLCSDLNEKILLRLMDLMQYHEETADHLYHQIRKNMQARHQVGLLLQKSQQVRNQTFENAQTMGLGVIL